MKRAAALFPYFPEHLPFAKFFDKLQNEYSLKELLSPMGLGLTGKDAGYALNHPEIGIMVQDCSKIGTSEWDTLIVDGSRKLDYSSQDEMNQCIRFARENQKDILFFAENEEELPNALLEYAEINPEGVDIQTASEVEKRDADYKKYNLIDTKVVLVGGLLDEPDVSEVVFGFAYSLRKSGLKATVLSKNVLAKVFGFHTYQHIFDNKDLTEAEKVMRLNHFVKELEKSEMPDVILLEAPDAVMQFNNYAPHGFGIRTYMLSKAIPPDQFICCVPFELCSGAFLDAISKDFEIRLGTEITVVHASNLVVDSGQMMESHEVSYAYVDLSMVQDRISKEKEDSRIPVFDVVGEGIDKMYQEVSYGSEHQ